MAEIPLILKLRRQSHKDLARAQDIIVRELYNVFNRPVLHGGIAIWRCYEGNRFSEDIDAYMPKDKEKINTLFENLESKGFAIKKRKTGSRSLYSRMELNRAIVRFEALFRRAKGSLREYRTADSNIITVYTLSPEELIREKVSAYLQRFKVRDLYDIFFLLRHVEDKREVSAEIKKLAEGFRKPADEKDLKVLIIEGLTPSAEDMMDYIKRAV